MSGAEAVLALMDRTCRQVNGWCMHAEDEEYEHVNETAWKAFSDMNADGVGTCVISELVYLECRRLWPDAPMWERIVPIEVSAS